MSALNLSQRDITAYDGTPVRLVYDQEADILEIFFGVNEPATGIDLTDHIVLRLNQQTKRAISLMLVNFSILTERTEYGPRSYPLDTLNDLPEDLRELVLKLIELFLNKKSGRLSSKKPWREPTDGDAHPRRPSDESPDRLVPSPIQRSATRVQRHLPGGAAENL